MDGSARSYLLTVLGEFVLPHGGSVRTSRLIEALAAVDVEERAARQAVARTASAGLLEGETAGRERIWHLTEDARTLLGDGTERIFSFHLRDRTWDGRWVILLCSVPEPARELRGRLRSRLGWAGYGLLSPGVWISPWVAREAEAVEVVASLGLTDARTFIGCLGSLGDPATLASMAWDLPSVDHSYGEFLTRHRDVAPRDRAEAFRALTLLVHDWRRLPFADPDLPAELLPVPWRGDEAAAVFHHQHQALLATATQWWHGA